MHLRERFFSASLLSAIVFLLFFSFAPAQTVLRERWREKLRERIQKKETKDDLGKNDYHFILEHGGLARKYNIHLPPQYNKNIPTPIVIYLHGGGGSLRAAYLDGMDEASDKFGFILVVPAGTGPVQDRLLTWNAGKWLPGKGKEGIESCCGYAAKNNIDDVDFISKMIEEIKNNFNVDINRIYVTGISNGGIMSYRLACELSDKIAAIAPVAPPAVPANCVPGRAVSVMHIHGTVDPCAPYNGGISGGCLGTEKREGQSAQQMVDIWKNINKCSGGCVIAYQKGDVTCISYNKCVGHSEVEFCTIEGGGHTWPSGSQYLPADRVGPVSFDISFDQIWEFFKKHPKKITGPEL